MYTASRIYLERGLYLENKLLSLTLSIHAVTINHTINVSYNEILYLSRGWFSADVLNLYLTSQIKI